MTALLLGRACSLLYGLLVALLFQTIEVRQRFLLMTALRRLGPGG